MVEISDDVRGRLDSYCESRNKELEETDPKWWGWEAFLWRTTDYQIIKVHRNRLEFTNELIVYQKLMAKPVKQIQGFQVPRLIDYDDSLWVLELSFVRPPYVLDFGRATLGSAPPGFDPESADWISEKRRLYGDRWPEVALLLDALRLMGIYFTDVHKGNICFEAADQANMSSPMSGFEANS